MNRSKLMIFMIIAAIGSNAFSMMAPHTPEKKIKRSAPFMSRAEEEEGYGTEPVTPSPVKIKSPIRGFNIVTTVNSTPSGAVMVYPSGTGLQTTIIPPMHAHAPNASYQKIPMEKDSNEITISVLNHIFKIKPRVEKNNIEVAEYSDKLGAFDKVKLFDRFSKMVITINQEKQSGIPFIEITLL